MLDADKYYGLKILDAVIVGSVLRLSLSGNKTIQIKDEASYCCEHRYMKCDDDVTSLIGHTLTRIEAKDCPYNEDTDEDYMIHNLVFIEVGTDKGFITLNNHNVHNGYYGGFELTITEY